MIKNTLITFFILALLSTNSYSAGTSSESNSTDYSKAVKLVKSAKKVFDAILDGKFKVEISKKYSLAETQKAHEDLEGRKLNGPAVIIP